jgi:hypothetical protein
VTAISFLYAERYDAVTEPHSLGTQLWKTVGIAVDTAVNRVDGLWGQNPSSAGVPNTTESHPHAVPNQKCGLTCELVAFPQYPPVRRTLWNL